MFDAFKEGFEKGLGEDPDGPVWVELTSQAIVFIGKWTLIAFIFRMVL